MINIYSCNYYSYEFLKFNYSIIKQLNQDIKFRWFVCDHTPDIYKKNINQEEFIVLNRQGDTQGSISLGNGMNFIVRYALEHFPSQYNLILEPDFILFVNVQDVFQYIKNKRLDLFGATYSPTSKKMLYGPPSIFCTFCTDAITKLDFMSDVLNYKEYNFYPDAGFKNNLACLNNQLKWKSVKLISKIRPDIYQWNKKLFGIHLHMKLHYGEKRSSYSHLLLKEIKNIIKNNKLLTSQLNQLKYEY